MADVASLVARVRRELGDFGQPFRDVFVGTGEASDYDMTETRINTVSVMSLSDAAATDLLEGTDYTIDSVDGRIFLLGAYAPLPVGTTLVVNGQTSGMFTDDELEHYINDAFLQHASGRTVKGRYRDADGFIRYREFPMGLTDLPEIEEQLVGFLAVIETLWALTTDASTDIDVTTADGTHIQRSQRYVQMRNQIDVLTEKYNELCGALNVGIHRIEMGNLRRVSRTTGRLVPLFEAREFDDYTLPTRLLPPIDGRDADESGVPTPAYSGYW